MRREKKISEALGLEYYSYYHGTAQYLALVVTFC